MSNVTRLSISASLALLIGVSACSAPSADDTSRPTQTTTRVAADVPAGFAAWRQQFRAKALSNGITPAVFDRAFSGISPDPEVIERDRFQPEYRRQIWDYLDRAVSDRRVSNGREKAAAYDGLLRTLEARYGVDRRVIVAIWGLESAYGATMGSMNVVRSLATLAHDGRRRNFAEEQLITALRILQNGDIPPERMFGSWAGAMGHTQFIPTSFTAYAQDFDGDGRRNVWASDPSDALASTANYLTKFGWTKGQPWGVEARLPEGFNFALADGSVWRDSGYWSGLGVQSIDGSPLPNHGEAALWAAAGARGPVFVVFKNFRVIKRYNNASSYALAVGHLGDRIYGGQPFRATWPRDEQALRVSETIELQERLTNLGYDTQGADGLVGPNTIAAIRSFQRAAGLNPDGFPTRNLLVAVKKAAGN